MSATFSVFFVVARRRPTSVTSAASCMRAVLPGSSAIAA